MGMDSPLAMGLNVMVIKILRRWASRHERWSGTGVSGIQKQSTREVASRAYWGHTRLTDSSIWMAASDVSKEIFMTLLANPAKITHRLKMKQAGVHRVAGAKSTDDDHQFADKDTEGGKSGNSGKTGKESHEGPGHALGQVAGLGDQAAAETQQDIARGEKQAGFDQAVMDQADHGTVGPPTRRCRFRRR